VDPTFNGNVTITIPTDSGPETTTVQARNGVATFPGLTAQPAPQGAAIQIAADGLKSVQTPPIIIVGPPPTASASVYFTRKTNKKGKPIGKPVFSGFKLVYSTAMSSSARQSTDYQVLSTVTKRVKKKLVTSHTNVPYKPSYDPTNTLTLSIKSQQPFAKSGGEIIISGATSQAGVPLSPSDDLFVILPKAKNIVPGSK
jgi:hypothetical protein